ncbi:MAG: winged helix DNA-binding domain-containing protein [Acidimicrobiales bacterium]
MTDDVLTARALNRATLERQLLLQRSPMPVLAAVEHLVGLQAQVPLNPYVGLWTRLAHFDPAVLGQLLIDRAVVRIVVMRGTLHLVTADDCLLLRPLVQPVLDGELVRHSEYGAPLLGIDVEPVLAFVRPLLAERPLTGPQLRAAIAAQFPHLHAGALAYACRNRLAFVQVPPRGVWGKSGQVTSTTAEAWLGRPLVAAPSIDEVVLRYLRAFGPATVADVGVWSRLTGLREVLERLQPQLRIFRDERGRELFDLPDAPRPDVDTPAPPRFLPEYDNVLLSHADRTRFVDPRAVGRPWDAPVVRGTVLADGLIAGTWHIDRDRNDDSVTLVVHHWAFLTKRAVQTIASEAKRFVLFHEGTEAVRDVRFVASAG